MIINLNKTSTEDTAALQKETMETMEEYLGNLIPKMEGMVQELRTEVLEDSWEFLRMMIDGFNWVIEGYNGCSDVINAKEKKISSDEIEPAIASFGKAYRAQNAEDTAKIMDEAIIPFLQKLQTVLSEMKEA